MTSDLRRKLVGNTPAAALFLLDPGNRRHRDPNRTLIDLKAHIHGVGVPGGDGDHICLPAAMKIFAGPAVGDMKVFVHVL